MQACTYLDMRLDAFYYSSIAFLSRCHDIGANIQVLCLSTHLRTLGRARVMPILMLMVALMVVLVLVIIQVLNLAQHHKARTTLRLQDWHTREPRNSPCRRSSLPHHLLL